jgi:hypothetical protein
MKTTRRLRADLTFRRIAVVLSGGGAMGAYEVGAPGLVDPMPSANVAR